MIIDCLVTHFDRFDSLAKCLGSLVSQTRPPRWIYALDDSNKDEQLWLLYQRMRFVPIRFAFREGKPQWSHKFNVGKESIDERCAQLGQPPPDLIGIFSCDFVLSQDYLAQAIACHERHPKSLVCAPGLNRSEAKASVRGGPIDGGDHRILSPDHADNGMCWTLPYKCWKDWDEAYDQIGFGHQVPDWLHRLSRAKVELWRCDLLSEQHIDHPPHPNMAEQVALSTPLYEKKIKL